MSLSLRGRTLKGRERRAKTENKGVHRTENQREAIWRRAEVLFIAFQVRTEEKRGDFREMGF